jgi:hypothetical protein
VTSSGYQSVVLDFNFDLQALILGKSSYKPIDINFDILYFCWVNISIGRWYLIILSIRFMNFVAVGKTSSIDEDGGRRLWSCTLQCLSDDSSKCPCQKHHFLRSPLLIFASLFVQS